MGSWGIADRPLTLVSCQLLCSRGLGPKGCRFSRAVVFDVDESGKSEALRSIPQKPSMGSFLGAICRF